MLKFNKYIILLNFVLMLAMPKIGTANNAILTKISFSFEFNQGSEVLEIDYINNRYELNNLDQFLNHNFREIKNNQAHLTIVSHIKHINKDDLLAINRACILASVVRAHIKMKYGLNNSNFSFYISCEEDINNMVTIQYKPYAIKPIDNQDIFYTQNAVYNQLVLTMLKYRNIPYLPTESNLVEHKAANVQTHSLPVIENNTEATKNEIINKKYAPSDKLVVKQVKVTVDTLLGKQMEEPIDVELLITDNNTLTDPKPQSDFAETSNPSQISVKKNNLSINPGKSFKPLIGVSTNILKLFGVAPSSNKNNLPNISLEYYYSKRLSVKLDGAATPLISNKININTDNWWKVSSLTFENRFWVGESGIFSGLYTGIFGMYGDFDIKAPGENTEGSTGNFYGAGLSLGYSLKICHWLSLEAGIRGCYRLDEWSSYEVRSDGYFLKESKSNKGFYVHDYNVGIVFRYGLKK